MKINSKLNFDFVSIDCLLVSSRYELKHTDDHFKVNLGVLFRFSKKKRFCGIKNGFCENKEIALTTFGNDKQSKQLFEQEEKYLFIIFYST